MPQPGIVRVDNEDPNSRTQTPQYDHAPANSDKSSTSPNPESEALRLEDTPEAEQPQHPETTPELSEAIRQVAATPTPAALPVLVSIPPAVAIKSRRGANSKFKPGDPHTPRYVF